MSGQQVPSPAVLVIVEDSSLGELLLDALADAGYRGVLADGRPAIEAALEGARLRCAIVDLDSRGLDGVGLARWLGTRAPGLPLMLLLACGGPAPPVEEVPHRLALQKPARLQALLGAIAAVAAAEVVQIAR